MSEATISNRRLAIGEIIGSSQVRMQTTGPQRLYRNAKARPRTDILSPTAYCLLPIVSYEAANSFTVTGQVTSVTHLGLAKSVLIDIGELNLGRRFRRVGSSGIQPRWPYIAPLEEALASNRASRASSGRELEEGIQVGQEPAGDL